MVHQNWNEIKTRTSGGEVSIDGFVEGTVIESFKAEGKGATFSIRNPREVEEDIRAGEAKILVSFDGPLTETELAGLRNAAMVSGRVRITGNYVPNQRNKYFGSMKAEKLEYTQ